ncbi:MAG: ABC transporter ATP-binding protein [Gammaproteobacteria bacterium]
MTFAYELQGIEFQYNKTPFLHIKECYFSMNETTALLGPNGAGKSTLINLLAFVTTPGMGNIKFLGDPVGDNSRFDVRRRVGYVQQNPYLFNVSVIQNVELGLKLRGISNPIRHHRAMNVIEQLGLTSFANKRVHDLSGGEAQRVAIARAMVLEPDVLIMDEPFTYLDKHSAQEIEKIIMSIRENQSQTIVFSTHDQMRAQLLADHICSMVTGRLSPVSLVNYFPGKLTKDEQKFDTGKVSINVPANINEGEHIAIESTQIVLSRTELDSSMRNMFSGKVRALNEENGLIHLVVDAGERFQVIITKSALDELRINAGDTVCLSFKSSAISIF